MIDVGGQGGDAPTIPELTAAMEAGEFSAVELAAHFIERIEALDGDYHAVIVVNPAALQQAAALDEERARGRVRGPLHGIPVLIKDNIETREMPTTAGSLALADNETGRDAPIISRLREAGALILGKTNLSEWANFRSERSSSGWSAVGGQTGNACDVTRSPCGSSAGSAVAVALGFAVAAVGTETNGSVICPAAMNGIVGIKPTVGLLPRSHIVPISNAQDTAGPMARSVVDAAILLAVMQGEADDDEATRGVPTVSPDHYLPAAPSLDGVRLGVVRGSVRHRRVQSLLDDRLARLEASGVTLVDDVAFQPYDGFDRDTYNILLFEFRRTIRNYLASLGAKYADWTLDDLIAFNVENHDREMPWFGQEIFEKSRDLDMSDTEYEAARDRARKATRDDGIDRMMAEHQLDAIVAPSNGPAWKIDWVHGDRGAGGFTTYPAVAGYPHITVPMGDVHGLPIGLSFTGGARCERRLLELACALEMLLRER